MADKKIYLEEGSRFMLTQEVIVAVTDGQVPLMIDMESFSGFVSDKLDPQSSDSMLVGSYLDKDDVNRPIYLERGSDKFYYYVPQPPHKTYLKEGTTFEAEWKESIVKVQRPAKLDIDEALTFSDDNLSHTELGNDGPTKGRFMKDGVSHAIFLEHLDNGESSYYCYLS